VKRDSTRSINHRGGETRPSWREGGRVRYKKVTDTETLDAFQDLSRLEGILPALESGGAVALALRYRSRESLRSFAKSSLGGVSRRGKRRDTNHLNRQLRSTIGGRRTGEIVVIWRPLHEERQGQARFPDTRHKQRTGPEAQPPGAGRRYWHARFDEI
jgi:hypothetical protein